MIRALISWILDNRRISLACGAGVIVVFIGIGLAFDSGPDVDHERARRNALRVEVDRAISGHKVKLDDGQSLKYAGIRAPYRSEPLFEEALRRNAELVEDEDVRLRFDRIRRDSDGRLNAYVFIGSDFINEILVREGLAYARLTPDSRRFGTRLLAAQKEAQENKRGLWKGKPPARERSYVADPKYGNFHRPSCEEVPKIKPERVVAFKARSEAFERGFAPCEKCAP